MNLVLSRKAHHAAIARCPELHRFDTEPLLLDGRCAAFALQFIKLMQSTRIHALLSSSADSQSCVDIVVPADAKELKKALATVLGPMSRAEAERALFPAAFAAIPAVVDERLVSEAKTPTTTTEADWVCPYAAEGAAFLVKMRDVRADETADRDRVRLWMTSFDRIGLIACLINNTVGGLESFLPDALPLLVYEMLAELPSVAYSSMDSKADLSLVFKDRLMASGGMLVGLPGRVSRPLARLDTVIAEAGAMATVFSLLCHTFRANQVKAIHFDGLLTAATEYFGDVARAAMTPPMPDGKEKKSETKRGGWQILPRPPGQHLRQLYTHVGEQCHAAITGSSLVIAQLVDAFLGSGPETGLIPDAIARGLMRQSYERLAPPETELRWRNTKFALITSGHAEELLLQHAHVDGVEALRAMWRADRDHESSLKQLRDAQVRILMQKGVDAGGAEGKDLLAQSKKLNSEPDVKLPPLIHVELKNVHAYHCLEGLSQVLNARDYSMCTYLSARDGVYNTLISTRRSSWNAYQAHASMIHFAPGVDGLARDESEGRDCVRMPCAPLVFQLFASGSEPELAVAFSAVARWCGAVESSPSAIRLFDAGIIENTLDTIKNLMAATALIDAKDGGDAKCADIFLYTKALVLGLTSRHGTDGKAREALFDLVFAGLPTTEAKAGEAREAADYLIAQLSKPVVPQDQSQLAYQSETMQRMMCRPRIKTACASACNYLPGSGAGLFGFLAYCEMSALGCDDDDIQKMLHRASDPTTATVCVNGRQYHSCTSTFDYPIGMVSPEMKIIFADSLVFVLRPDYDTANDLSPAYLWFEYVFGVRHFNPRLFVGINKNRAIKARPRDVLKARKRNVLMPLHLNGSGSSAMAVDDDDESQAKRARSSGDAPAAAECPYSP